MCQIIPLFQQFLQQYDNTIIKYIHRATQTHKKNTNQGLR